MKNNQLKPTSSKSKLENSTKKQVKDDKKFSLQITPNLSSQKSDKIFTTLKDPKEKEPITTNNLKSLNSKGALSTTSNIAISKTNSNTATKNLSNNLKDNKPKKSSNYNANDTSSNILNTNESKILDTQGSISNNPLNTNNTNITDRNKDAKEEELIENEYKPKKLEERDPTLNPEASKVEQKDSNNIKVVCRFRPLNNFEKELLDSGTGKLCVEYYDNDPTSVKVISEMSTSTPPFHLDKIFRSETTQSMIYDQAAKELLLDVVNGYNGTIFTYGQSGSGKTHTMYGADIYDDETKGIIPRVIDNLFEIIHSSPENISYQIKFSIIQIYKEVVYDLLSGEKDLKVKESPSKGIYVEGLSEFFIDNIENFLELLELSQSQRIVSGTNLNSQSSRSHTIFMLELTSTNNIKNITKKGIMNLVDLAGTEKISKSGAVGKTLEEGIKINLSLSALGNVIHALTTGESFIPYRDSKLTRILQESLGGNFKTTLLVTCSPHSYHFEETISTLKFAQRAKTIKNKVKMNIKLSYDQLLKIISNYKDDIAKLNKNNEKLKNRIRGLIASGNILNTTPEELFNLDDNTGFEELDSTNNGDNNVDCSKLTEVQISLKHDLEEKNELINSMESQIIELKKEIKDLKANLEEKEELLSQNNTDILRQANSIYGRVLELKECKKESKKQLIIKEKDNLSEENIACFCNITSANRKFINECTQLLVSLKNNGLETLSQEALEKLTSGFMDFTQHNLLDNNFIEINNINSDQLVGAQISFNQTSQIGNNNTFNNGINYTKLKLVNEVTNAFCSSIINQNKILTEESYLLMNLIEDLTDVNNNLINRAFKINEDMKKGNFLSSFINNQGQTTSPRNNKKFGNFFKGIKNFLTKSIIGRSEDTLGGTKVEKFVDKKTLMVAEMVRRQSNIEEENILKELIANEEEFHSEKGDKEDKDHEENHEAENNIKAINVDSKEEASQKKSSLKKSNFINQMRPIFKFSMDSNDGNEKRESNTNILITTPDNKNTIDNNILDSDVKFKPVDEFNINSIGKNRLSSQDSSDAKCKSSRVLRKVDKSQTLKPNFFKSLLRKTSNTNIFIEDCADNKEVEERMKMDENLQYLLKAINSHKENFNSLREFIKKSFGETERLKTIYDELRLEIFSSNEIKNSTLQNLNRDTKTHQPKQTKFSYPNSNSITSNQGNYSVSGNNNYILNSTNQQPTTLSNLINNTHVNTNTLNSSTYHYENNLEKIDESSSENSSEEETKKRIKNRQATFGNIIKETSLSPNKYEQKDDKVFKSYIKR